jgi:ammonia channel protein AmtB
MDIPSFLIVPILGFGVLTSYYYVFKKKLPDYNYNKHPFWMGIPSDIVNFLVILQILAGIGFLIAICSWIASPPQDGIMGNAKSSLPLTLSGFLLSSIIWPLATLQKKHFWVAFSLVTAAISTILLLAGSIEESNIRWYIVISLIFLNIVTVLCDAVIWNAKYIYTVKNNGTYLNKW